MGYYHHREGIYDDAVQLWLKCGVSGQTVCSYLMVHSWENDRHGTLLECLGFPKAS